MKDPLPLVVLISGTGSTLQHLIEQIRQGHLSARIVKVISSRAHVLGVERAKQANLPTEIISRKSFSSWEDFATATFDSIQQTEAQYVILAGYMQRLMIPRAYENRVLNIHPSLLPAFGGQGMYGHHVHEAVLEYGAKVTGCTVHFVDEEYDHGPIIAQTPVRVEAEDTPESLAARVQQAERALYPEVIQALAERRVSIHGRRVRVSPRI
jgi:phosphoribosylglycinamide formyltransferase-1